MENFATEVISTITEAFMDDTTTGKELTRDILGYLYHVTDDEKLGEQICNWFTKNNYCIGCGTELLSYEYEEGDDKYIVSLCPNCEKAEIEEGHYRKVEK
jgi:uncharacterized protein with PIN domain